jgi:predicted AAA+ superfamily ATPase
MTLADLEDFDAPDLPHRLLQGGLPPFFLSPEPPEREFQEWMDAFWAKDVQELFRLERRRSFQKFLELMLAQSGGIFEATRFAAPCEVSRSTITNYLAVLEATFVLHVVPPFSSRRQTEIIAAPKVYGFDTGFVCAFRGWHSPLRGEELGRLWEHFVLNEMHARLQTRQVRYWRDKRGHEVDFVWAVRGKPPVAIECKWSASDFDAVNFQSFASIYPQSEFHVVATDVVRPFVRQYGALKVQFVGLDGLLRKLESH